MVEGESKSKRVRRLGVLSLEGSAGSLLAAARDFVRRSWLVKWAVQTIGSSAFHRAGDALAGIKKT